MADISKAYRRLMNRLLPEDKLAALYEGIDREAMGGNKIRPRG